MAAHLRLIHPFAVIVKVVACATFALLSTQGVPSPTRLAALLAGVFLSNAGIGALNDYCDRDLDATAKPWKPIVAGQVQPPCGPGAGRDGAGRWGKHAGLATASRAAVWAALHCGGCGLRSWSEAHDLELAAVRHCIPPAAALELDGSTRLGPTPVVDVSGGCALGAGVIVHGHLLAAR